MKKIIFTLLIVFATSNMFAQVTQKIEYWSNIEATLGVGMIFELNTTQGITYDRFHLGLSTGYGTNTDQVHKTLGHKTSIYGFYIPLQLNARVDLATNKTLVPYFAIKAGGQWFINQKKMAFNVYPVFGVQCKNIFLATGIQGTFHNKTLDEFGEPYARDYFCIFSLGYTF
ncbi:MAG: hypothetical protein J6V28_03520 [Tidjanibacter sp.]|nr:hypothetical protein [Tidjanibacter sp.]